MLGGSGDLVSSYTCNWEFPKIRGTLFWGPYNQDPTIWGTIFGSPIFGNSQLSIILRHLLGYL